MHAKARRARQLPSSTNIVDESAAYALVAHDFVRRFAREQYERALRPKRFLRFPCAAAGGEHVDEVPGRSVETQYLAAAGAAHVQIAVRAEEQLERIVHARGELIDERARPTVVTQYCVAITERQALGIIEPAAGGEGIDERTGRGVVAENAVRVAAADQERHRVGAWRDPGCGGCNEQRDERFTNSGWTHVSLLRKGTTPPRSQLAGGSASVMHKAYRGSGSERTQVLTGLMSPAGCINM